jgi:hypothetical protein
MRVGAGRGGEPSRRTRSSSSAAATALRRCHRPQVCQVYGVSGARSGGEGFQGGDGESEVRRNPQHVSSPPFVVLDRLVSTPKQLWCKDDERRANRGPHAACTADGARKDCTGRRRARPAPLPLDRPLPGPALLNSRLTNATLKGTGKTACIAFLFCPVGLPYYSHLAALIRHSPHEDTDDRALVVAGALPKRKGRLSA